jgi:CRISPR-associated protein Cas1
MSWRIVVVSSSAKLDLQLGCLVIRSDTTTKIHLNEIATLLVESTAVSITVSLMSELIKHKIKVIFCDEKRNPSSELIGYYGSHDTSSKIKQQIVWKSTVKDAIWTEIVTEKIRQQMNLLFELRKENEAALLSSYIREMEFRDETNREGHAAKVYFNALFGLEFTRTLDNHINAALNYGYSILLSAFNREIASNGYLTQLGMFHDNMFNPFNLASDMMEPFRVLIDRKVVHMRLDKFEHEEKMQLVDVLNGEVIIEGHRSFVNNAIKIYCKSIFNALNTEDISEIRFYTNEL